MSGTDPDRLGGSDAARFGFAPDLANAGWFVRPSQGDGCFPDIFGTIRVKPDANGSVRCRFPTEPRHRNIVEHLHGGYLMAAIDQALFMVAVARGALGVEGGVTLDCTTHFIDAGEVGPALDIVGQVLRATGGHVFLQGVAEQEGRVVASFSGTIRRFSPRA